MEDTEKLYIVHSKLEEIPNIESGIKTIDLRRNLISEMTLNKCESVEYLDLSDNKIKNIENIENLPNLKILDLSYNLISEIRLPPNQLTELYIIANDIDKIGSLNLKNIKKLDLACNNIEKIEGLDDCSTLIELYLGGNNISVVENLKHLSYLKVLDLQNNNIKELDCEILPKGLKTLLLTDNKDFSLIKNVNLLPELKILGVERTKIIEGSIEGPKNIWYK